MLNGKKKDQQQRTSAFYQSIRAGRKAVAIGKQVKAERRKLHQELATLVLEVQQ